MQRLNKEMKDFTNLFMSDYCVRIFRENKMINHIETGNIYLNNYNTNESNYDFFF